MTANAPGTAPKKLPAALQANIWRPGQSGNPQGARGPIVEARRIAREYTPAAMLKLVELMNTSRDERVALLAAQGLLDRSMGKPKEAPPDGDEYEQKKIDLRKLLRACDHDELETLKGLFKKIAALQADADQEKTEIVPVRAVEDQDDLDIE